MDRVWNKMVCIRAGIENELAIRMDERVLRWFEHVETMDEYRVARMVLVADVSGGWGRSRQRLGWINGMKVALGKRDDGGGDNEPKIGRS